MNISEMSAIDLDNFTKDASGDLKESLGEIDRLRGLLTDVIDLINTSSQSARLYDNVAYADSAALLDKIDDIAHGYYTAK